MAADTLSKTPYPVHPFATILPDLRQEEMARLEADVLAHGFRDAITLYQGQILDGRHRAAIAQKHSQVDQLITREFAGDDAAAIAFVWSGVAGRDLTDGARVAAVLKRDVFYEGVKDRARERQIAAGAAHGVKGAAHGVKGGRGKRKPPCGNSATRGVSAKKKGSASKSRDVVAKAAGTSARTAQKVITVQAEAPDLFVAVAAGTQSPQAAMKEVKRRRTAAKRQQAAEEAAAAIQHVETDYWVRHGDMASAFADVPDETVPLIFTDPPYHDEHLDLYDHLGALASRILIDGGSLITYTSHHKLPVVIDKLTRAGLTFFWPLAVIHTGQSARMTEYGIVVKHKPLLWFVKGKFRDRSRMTFVDDAVLSQQEKTAHPWQQSVIEAGYFITQLTEPGELVIDPFCGGGTTALAAMQAGRQWLTSDVADDAVVIARQRLHEGRVA